MDETDEVYSDHSAHEGSGKTTEISIEENSQK